MGERPEKGGKRVVGRTRWRTEGGERGTVASSLLRSAPLRLRSSLPPSAPPLAAHHRPVCAEVVFAPPFPHRPSPVDAPSPLAWPALVCVPGLSPLSWS